MIVVVVCFPGNNGERLLGRISHPTQFGAIAAAEHSDRGEPDSTLQIP